MDAVKLRQRWDCEASHCVRIALALKGIAYAIEDASPALRETATDRASARATTPELEIDGVVLSEALAILEWLEETHFDPPLLPGAAAERARVRALAHAIVAGFAPVVDERVADHVIWLTAGDGETRANWMRRFISRAFTIAERMLDSPMTGPFCHGDEPGLADCVLAAHVRVARRWGTPLVGFPRILAIDLRCATHPAFVEANPDVARPVEPARRGR
jgi:maleylacetoacetate isomerase